MSCIITGSQLVDKLDTTTGRKILIEYVSTEEELIKRWMESHLGFRMTTMLVNEHRREEGKEQVGVSAVMDAFYRLQPKVSHTKSTVRWSEPSMDGCKLQYC